MQFFEESGNQLCEGIEKEFFVPIDKQQNRRPGICLPQRWKRRLSDIRTFA